MSTSPGRRALRRWIPNQHGAWAMLVVPFLAGALPVGFDGWHALLLPAWLLAYCAAFHAQQFVRLRRLSRNPRAPRRHLAPLTGFGAAFAVCAVPLVVAHSWLLIAALCAAPFFAVNIGYAYRNKERATVNGIAAVVPACGMLLVSYRLGSGTVDSGAWQAAAACLLYFAGTVLYVKTMIRERGSEAFRVASAVYHGLAVLAAVSLDPWLAVPFVLFFVRAMALPARRVRIAVVGAVEVLCSVLLLAFIVCGGLLPG
ncbi:YwiC-like family protein [Streptomyces chrestomyceticus]|uniref:YwiC-like family protein n=1 Tax=Streptomyces chrestomyceticus TaxID=68185 RepID=UPI0034106869